ncbi:MAG: TetR/AcrR family transcriptional regulator [Actinobacteria bacterium]|nr:TetR/AcrR family transcriptional regulator [Actinomycetota bacterium]
MADLPRHLARGAVGRERLSREALASYQRDRILITATGVFAKRGYQQTTVEHIVDAWGGSVGSFYGHFDGKESCFLAVFDRVVEQGRQRLAGAVAGEESWAAQAYASLGALIEAAVAEPLAAGIILVEAPSAGAQARKRYLALLDELAARLRGGRSERPEALALPETFEQAAVGGTAYFLQQRLLASEVDSAAELLAETSQVVLEPILGAAELRRLGSTPALAG